MSYSIGFKNFRKFADFPELDLGDITILVGGNNSGKSTLVKALLLCMDNLRNMCIGDRKDESIREQGFTKPLFRFDLNEFGHDVKIKTFSRAIYNRPVPDYENEDLEDGIESQSLPTTITFKFSIGRFAFVFVVSGDRDEQLTTGDVLLVSVEDTTSNFRFENNYENRTMTFTVTNKETITKLLNKAKLYTDYKNKKKALAEATEQGNLKIIKELTSEIDNIATTYNVQYGFDVQLSDIMGVDLDFDIIAMNATNASSKSVVVKYEDFSNVPDARSLFRSPNERVVESCIRNFINYAFPKKAYYLKKGRNQE